MRKALLPLMTTLIIMVPYTANACEAYQSPQTKVGHIYDAVVVVTILNANYTNSAPRMRPWQAKAKLKHVIEGHNMALTYTFRVFDNSPACKYWQPIAVAGEDWVLYLRKHDRTGHWGISEAYPLSFARNIDKRFTGQP